MKYIIDKNVFKNIDCEWKAYFLGLLFSDGNISKDLSNCCITLIDTDRYILEALGKLIYESNKLPLYRKFDKRSNCSDTYKLYICRKNIVKNLVNLGCPPQKSLILKFPENLSENLFFNHFVRGFFDGNGSINYSEKTNRPEISIYSSHDFIAGLYKFVSDLGIVCKKYKASGYNPKTSRLFIVRKEDVKKFYHYIYSDSTLFLNRKKDKYNNIFIELESFIKKSKLSLINKDRKTSMIDLIRVHINNKWKPLVYKRDGYKCYKCCKCGEKDGLQAHHLKSVTKILNEFLEIHQHLDGNNNRDKGKLLNLSLDYKPFWDIDNGITLCCNCHQAEHSESNLDFNKLYKRNIK